MRRIARALARAEPLVALPALDQRPAFLAGEYRAMRLRCLCPVCLGLDARYPGEGYQLALFEYQRSFRP